MIDVGLGRTENVRQMRTRVPRHYAPKGRRHHKVLRSIYRDNGLNAGLNKGFFKKLSLKNLNKVFNPIQHIKQIHNNEFVKRNTHRFVKKNVNLKNLVTVASIAASVIPGGQALTAVAIAAKIGKAAKLAKIVLTASKLAKLAKVVKLGMKAYQLYKSPVVQAVMDKIKEGKQVTPQEESIVNQVAVANDIDPNTPNVLTPEEFKAVAPPNAVQAVAPIIASTDVEKKKANDIAVSQTEKAIAPVATPLPTATNNNTMLYVGGGVLALGLIYVLTKKKQ